MSQYRFAILMSVWIILVVSLSEAACSGSFTVSGTLSLGISQSVNTISFGSRYYAAYGGGSVDVKPIQLIYRVRVTTSGTFTVQVTGGSTTPSILVLTTNYDCTYQPVLVDTFGTSASFSIGTMSSMYIVVGSSTSNMTDSYQLLVTQSSFTYGCPTLPLSRPQNLVASLSNSIFEGVYEGWGSAGLIFPWTCVSTDSPVRLVRQIIRRIQVTETGRYMVTSAVNYTSTNSVSGDSMLMILDSSGCNVVSCNDNRTSTDRRSELYVELNQGDVVYLIMGPRSNTSSSMGFYFGNPSFQPYSPSSSSSSLDSNTLEWWAILLIAVGAIAFIVFMTIFSSCPYSLVIVIIPLALCFFLILLIFMIIMSPFVAISIPIGTGVVAIVLSVGLIICLIWFLLELSLGVVFGKTMDVEPLEAVRPLEYTADFPLQEMSATSSPYLSELVDSIAMDPTSSLNQLSPHLFSRLKMYL